MAQALKAEFAQTLVDGLLSRTLTSCSRWSEHRRFLQDLNTGELRPFSTRYHPWVKETLDTRAPWNWIMKSAQVGFTEAAINRAFYTLDRKRKSVLYVLPSGGVAADFSRTRFKTALDASPYLREMFDDTDTVGLKVAANGSALYIRGSRGDANLVSIPASVLILDELDRMEISKVWLAFERLSGQIHKEVWGLSTPTIPNYGIHKLFLTSTQEGFYFPCPSCSRQIKLTFPECVEVIGESVSDPRCHESYLKCNLCQNKLPHEAKMDWLAPATWVVENVNANPDTRGFHINQLYSYTITPGELVVAHFRGYGDELAATEFKNSKLGLPYIGDGAKIDDVMLGRCIGNHSKEDARPTAAGRMITMGVDQGKWGYVVVKEWFYKRAVHDLNTHATCKILWQGKFYEDQWSLLDTLMSEWQIMGCVIDADPEINEARRFARRYPGYVWLCRYRRGQVLREISVTDEDDAPIATVDRSNWLSVAMGRYKTDPPRIALPHDISQEFKDHLQNVVATYTRGDDGNPKLEFVSTGADHYAHADTYAEIALPLSTARDYNRDISSLV